MSDGLPIRLRDLLGLWGAYSRSGEAVSDEDLVREARSRGLMS